MVSSLILSLKQGHGRASGCSITDGTARLYIGISAFRRANLSKGGENRIFMKLQRVSSMIQSANSGFFARNFSKSEPPWFPSDTPAGSEEKGEKGKDTRKSKFLVWEDCGLKAAAQLGVQRSAENQIAQPDDDCWKDRRL
jgi:hypothetical protein